MSSVLFVDDEPLMCEFYGQLADELGENIEVNTAPGGNEALRILEVKKYDIVVSDLEMPAMNGGEFLTQVERLYPETMRIVLSGVADQAAVARCLMFGHRYFLKPLKLEQLAAALVRIVRLRAVMNSEKTRLIVDRADAFPTPPETYLRLLDVLDETEESILHVAQVLESNSDHAAKLLKIVNSTGFADHEVLSVIDAVRTSGIEVVRTIILALHAQSFAKKRIQSKMFLEAHWNHSISTASACMGLARSENQDRVRQSECFTAGLMHDVGKLILASCSDDTYLELLNVADSIPLHEREKNEYGVSHAEIGAYLLGLWGLPDSIIEAVESHHNVNGEIDELNPGFCIYAAQTLKRSGNLSPDPKGFSLSAELTLRIPVWKKTLSTYTIYDEENPHH